MKKNKFDFNGFTIIEVLLSISIALLLMGGVIPLMQDALDFTKTLSITHELIRELSIARNEAMCQNKPITLKPATKEWANRRQLIDSHEDVLQTFRALPEKFNLYWHSSLGANDKIEFLPTGFTQGQRGSFYLQSPYRTIRIIIEISGRIRTEGI